jgi:hypothetical protein
VNFFWKSSAGIILKKEKPTSGGNFKNPFFQKIQLFGLSGGLANLQTLKGKKG